jgi:hypothetical protein
LRGTVIHCHGDRTNPWSIIKGENGLTYFAKPSSIRSDSLGLKMQLNMDEEVEFTFDESRPDKSLRAKDVHRPEKKVDAQVETEMEMSQPFILTAQILSEINLAEQPMIQKNPNLYMLKYRGWRCIGCTPEEVKDRARSIWNWEDR